MTTAPEGPMKILVVTPFAETEWEWFGRDFGGGSYAWEFRNLSLFGKKPWTWLARALRVAREASEHDLVLTHHPYMAFYMSLALRLRGRDTPLYAFSFNHGNGLFFRGAMRRLAIQAFRRVLGLVVYSEQEKQIYGSYYHLPLARFSFVHWAVQPPDVDGPLPSYLRERGPYACCMGRNNRDFELFLEAVSDLGIPAIVVCKAGRLRSEQVPHNVTVHCDIPEKEAMQILAHSALSVVPLKDASRGAGHITVVAAMQLGIPQVITRLATVADYFQHDVHGLFVEPGSRTSLRDAMARLWSDPKERERMASAAHAFAARWLDETASRRHLLEYLTAIRDGEPPPPHPQGWRAEMGGPASSCGGRLQP